MIMAKTSRRNWGKFCAWQSGQTLSGNFNFTQYGPKKAINMDLPKARDGNYLDNHCPQSVQQKMSWSRLLRHILTKAAILLAAMVPREFGFPRSLSRAMAQEAMPWETMSVTTVFIALGTFSWFGVGAESFFDNWKRIKTGAIGYQLKDWRVFTMS